MWFLIGSRAIREITDDFYRDVTNSDLDLYCSKEDFIQLINECKTIEKCFPLRKNKYRLKVKNYPEIELKIYDEKSVYFWLSQNEQKELLSDKKYKLENFTVHIPTLNCLKYIKQSHLYWPIHWIKNIEDFTWLKEKTKNTQPNKKEVHFFIRMKKEMKMIHGKIPSGHITKIEQLNEEYVSQELINQNYEKKLIYCIHEKLSLKNKIKIIHYWNNFRYLLKQKHEIKIKNKS